MSHGDDESLASLLKSIKAAISANKNQEPDLLEDEHITRMSGTHPSLTLTALIKTRMQTSKPHGGVPLIEHENIIQKWSPETGGKGFGSDLSPQLLGRIGRLCGCCIEHAGDSAELLIKADRERDIDKGILKLEQVNKMTVSLARFARRLPTFTPGLILTQILRELQGKPITDDPRLMK